MACLKFQRARPGCHGREPGSGHSTETASESSYLVDEYTTDPGPAMDFETNKATSVQTIPPTRVQAFKCISPSCPHTLTSTILYFVSIVAITGNSKGFNINSRALLHWYREEKTPCVGRD